MQLQGPVPGQDHSVEILRQLRQNFLQTFITNHANYVRILTHALCCLLYTDISGASKEDAGYETEFDETAACMANPYFIPHPQPHA
jgi:hypothetical protein